MQYTFKYDDTSSRARFGFDFSPLDVSCQRANVGHLSSLAAVDSEMSTVLDSEMAGWRINALG
jgi:hypothetical protein